MIFSAPRQVKASDVITDPISLETQPIDPRRRFNSIDTLRGIALFGVLIVNLTTEFRVSIFKQFLPPDPRLGGLEWVIEAVIRCVFDMKAFALFSLLFGIGMAAQFDRLSKTRRPFYYLTRRLLCLLAFGIIHLCLIWNGDILTEYAIAGLIALPFLSAPRSTLAIASGIMFAVYLFYSVVPMPVSFPDQNWIQQHVIHADHVYSTGNFIQTLQFNIQELPYIFPLHAYIFPRTLGFFLLGAFVWRTGLIQMAAGRKRVIGTIALIGLSLGGILTYIQETGVITSLAALGPFRWALIGNITPIVLACGYAASIVWLSEVTSVQKTLGYFASLGRMAFTNYIMQSIIFGFIFFGYGFGEFGHLNRATALIIGTFVYLAQIFFSRWWLKYNRFGPLEWLWRTLMYGARQPMAKDQLMN